MDEKTKEIEEEWKGIEDIDGIPYEVFQCKNEIQKFVKSVAKNYLLRMQENNWSKENYLKKGYSEEEIHEKIVYKVNITKNEDGNMIKVRIFHVTYNQHTSMDDYARDTFQLISTSYRKEVNVLGTAIKTEAQRIIAELKDKLEEYEG